MTKQDFLDKLRAALNGRVSTSVITDNINYYEDYINTQMRLGIAENQVLQELGDPRMIARTIIDAEKRADMGTEQKPEQVDDVVHENGDAKTHYVKMPGWLLAVIILAVVILVLAAVFSFLSLIAPILIPVLFVLLLVRWARR